LFSDVPTAQKILDVAAGDPTVINSRHVTVNFGNLLGKTVPQGAPRVSLNLFRGLSLVAAKSRVEKRSPTSYTWFGAIEGSKDSSVIIVVSDESMAANIAIEGAMYQVRAIGDGVHAIYQIDQSAFPEEGPPIVVELPFDADAALSASTDAECTTIDVMVVYTDDVATASAAIGTEIQLAIDETNQSYVNSNMGQRLRLVHSAEVDYEESGDNTDLSRLVNPSDGHLDDVHTWRDT
jgi:hypothetical protein